MGRAGIRRPAARPDRIPIVVAAGVAVLALAACSRGPDLQPVATIAHSGSIGEAFLAAGPRVGYRTVISAGSELSRDLADFVAYLAEDDGTRALGLFVETVRRPDAFAAARQVPESRALCASGPARA